MGNNWPAGADEFAKALGLSPEKAVVSIGETDTPYKYVVYDTVSADQERTLREKVEALGRLIPHCGAVYRQPLPPKYREIGYQRIGVFHVAVLPQFPFLNELKEAIREEVAGNVPDNWFKADAYPDPIDYDWDKFKETLRRFFCLPERICSRLNRKLPRESTGVTVQNASRPVDPPDT